MDQRDRGSALLNLPAEVKERIYRFLFPQTTAIIRTEGYATQEPETDYAYIEPSSKSAQYLYCSRQALEEARPILYDHTTFSMNFTHELRRSLYEHTLGQFRVMEIRVSAQADEERWKKIVTYLKDSPLRYCNILVTCPHWVHRSHTKFTTTSGLKDYEKVYETVRKQALDLFTSSDILNDMLDESKQNVAVSFVLRWMPRLAQGRGKLHIQKV